MLINQVRVMYSSWSQPWGNHVEVVPQRKAKGLLAAKGSGGGAGHRASVHPTRPLPLLTRDRGLQEGAGHHPNSLIFPSVSLVAP